MRSHLRLASIFALTTGLAACSFGCSASTSGTGDELDAEVDSAIEDSSTAEVEIDSGADTGTVEDTTVEETTSETGDETSGETSAETGDETSVDSGSDDTADTFVEETTADSGGADTMEAAVDTAPACEVGGACDDGNACTTGETYNASCVCSGGVAKSCDDSDVCTVDTCVASTGCVYTPAVDGTSCGAGKMCTGGMCGDACTPGAACDDGNACTTGSTFNASCVCTGGTAISCNDSNPCTTDSCNTATGCVNAPASEGMSVAGCAAPNVCKAGSCIDPTALAPTIKITSPLALSKKGITASGKAADTCDPITFTLAVNAPQKIQTVSWHFFTPTTSTGMNGDYCGAPAMANPPWRAGLGNPIYAHKVDESKYAGQIAATFTENVAAQGFFNNTAAGGLWLWCTTPGTSGTAFLTSPTGGAIPAPSTGLTPLARYCHSTTLPADTETAKQWTLIVQVTDQMGQKATDEIKFFVYKK